MPRFVTITVDTEEEWDWELGYPTRLPASVNNIAELPRLQDSCDRFGAAVTYFVNYAVLCDPTARRVVAELAQRPNVEIGFHIHPWNTPPLDSREKVPPRESFLHNLPWELAQAKLETVWSAFQEMGLKPVSYRGGRYSTSPEIQRWLRERGFIADCSIVPFATWPDEGAPDYRSRDLRPRRHPPEEGFPAGFWELPLSFGVNRRRMRFWMSFLEGAAKAPWRWFRIVGILDRLGWVRKSWLNLETPDGDRMLDFLKVLQRLDLPALCWTFHSSSLVVGGNPYATTGSNVQTVWRRLEMALQEMARRPEAFTWATSAQVAQHLERTACE
jgi:hypothetical protein